MKKMNYYAVQNPWRVPKWLGAILGCAFGVIAVGSAVAIVQLTRPPAPPMVAVAPPATPAPTVHAAAAPAPAVSAPLASADEAAPAPSKRHASKRHASSHGKKGGFRLASAKHSGPALDSGKRATILAKHDTKEKRQQKDALDKLLGL